jgi:hypothetical protein
LTQTELARAARLAQTYVGRLESAITEPGIASRSALVMLPSLRLHRLERLSMGLAKEAQLFSVDKI